MGVPVTAETFAFRTDDLIAAWQAVRAGLGIGFVADYLGRSDSQVLPLLPALKLPVLPMWLAVHREIRSSGRIRAVYDFLASQLPKAM
jgi:DNA-binding transcriptional LysR family regulator